MALCAVTVAYEGVLWWNARSAAHSSLLSRQEAAPQFVQSARVAMGTIKDVNAAVSQAVEYESYRQHLAGLMTSIDELFRVAYEGEFYRSDKQVRRFCDTVNAFSTNTKWRSTNGTARSR